MARPTKTAAKTVAPAKSAAAAKKTTPAAGDHVVDVPHGRVRAGAVAGGPLLTHIMTRFAHWEHVYQTKGPDQVSWFQAEARLSRQIITAVAPDRTARIVDIGAGASTLVDALLHEGYRDVTVLDLSPAALAITQSRLGDAAAAVHWQAGDVLEAEFPHHAFDVWHDRAVFHFLTAAEDRARYVQQVRHAVRPGGVVIVATFADDGPTRCSGLDVARYAPEALHAEFGAGFALVESHRELHTTPAGATQAFTYCVCRVAA